MHNFFVFFDKFESYRKQAAKDVVSLVLKDIQKEVPNFHKVSYKYTSSRNIVLFKINDIEVESRSEYETLAMFVEMNLKSEEVSWIRPVLNSDDFRFEVMTSELGQKFFEGKVVELKV